MGTKSKQSNYVKRNQIALKLHDAETRAIQRLMTLDVVTITLGKLGMNPDDLEQFRNAFMETEEEYITEIQSDYTDNHDRSITYAKDRIDRAMREYLPDEMFVPWDQRYVSAVVAARSEIKV